ncbi:recombinase family protein [Streptomyces sp. NRRL S-237]|uniref:recombinase family protein n=1 Tax=Streptomyces sp. NRRL S-237 TaxID=1463895 RepID=UPI000AD54ACC|nr:recombinase family protein [Streptomyces sp. NRRL S-237]
MTAFTAPQNTDWMDRDNAIERQWSRLGARPVRQADPLARLVGFRTDGVRAGGELARQNGRIPRVVRYLHTPLQEAGAQFEALELMCQARHWLVREELCVDPIGPALLEDREGLSAALDLLSAGFADGLVTPTYEHISPDLREYERFLKEMATRGWFVALARPETEQ